MLLLIDGYNLLHQSDLLGRGRGQRWLQQARDRLVQRLAERLDAMLADEPRLGLALLASLSRRLSLRLRQVSARLSALLSQN